MTELRYGQKFCTRCRTLKPLDKFSPDKHQRFGVIHWCKECINKQVRERYRNDPELREKRNKAIRDRRRNDPEYREKQNKAAKDRYRNDPKERARRNKYDRDRTAMIKAKAYEKLGGAFCVGYDGPCKWEVTDIRCLQIDHVHGDGAEDRKNIHAGERLYAHIVDDLTQEEARSKYQVLCANCNAIKAGLERVREQPTN